MLFINFLMLFGLLAVAIPVIIQLLTRRKLRNVQWGAWLFLDKTVRKRKRKIILEDILLIACRCLALALLALAFARPFIRPDSRVPWSVTLPLLLLSIVAVGASLAVWRNKKVRRILMATGILLFGLVVGSIVFERRLNLNRLGHDATKDVVLVLDASASMSVVNDGRSNLDRAIEEMRSYVKSAPPETCFSIVIGGPVPAVLDEVPISDRRLLTQRLDALAERFKDGKLKGTMQIGGCLTAAGVVLQAGHNPIKQIVVVGDGQTLGWQMEDKARWKTVHQMFESLGVDPQIVWRTLPLPDSVRNVTVASVRPVREIVGTDREAAFEVTVVNKGSETVTPGAVSFLADGREQKQTETNPIQPGESRVYVFRHRFARAGAEIVTAKVDCPDDIPSDNECDYAMPVVGSLKVLIVGDGERSLVGPGGSAAYVNLALRPELVRAAAEASGTDREFLVATTVEDVEKVAKRTSFCDFAAVIVSGVRWLPQPTMEALAAFAHGGGGVWFMPAPGCDAEAYAKWTHEGEPVLPAPLGSWRDNSSPIDPPQFGPLLASYRTGSDLGSATPACVMAFGDGWQSETETVVKLADGTPFVLARHFGKGLIVQTAAPLDEASGLVYKHGFLPMVHELTAALARPTAVTLNVRPAESLTLFLGKTTSSHGLIANYYPSLDRRSVQPVMRMDPKIDFDWGEGAPLPENVAPGFPRDNFSVTWRGVLQPPKSGTYKFVFDIDDRFVLKIGSQEVRNWGSMKLDAGRSYPVVATYEEDYVTAYIRLKWQPPGEKNFQIIPPTAFRAELAGSEGAGELVRVTDPHGESFDGEIYQKDEGLYLHLTRSVVPGHYTVAGVPETLAPWIENVLTPDKEIYFSVSTDADESEMTPVNSEQIAALNESVHLLQALKAQDVIDEIAGQGFGKEIWRLLAVAAFLLLVVEPAIARWIAINRRTGDIIDTEGSWIRT